MDLIDVAKFVHNYIIDHGYGIVDFTPYFNDMTDDIILKALELSKYTFNRLRSGLYMINLEIFSEEDKQKVIDFVNKYIEEFGFNEEGQLEIDTGSLFDLNPISIITIIESMGYECFIGSDFGIYIISLPKEEDIEISDDGVKLVKSVQFFYENGSWDEDNKKTVFYYTDLTTDQIKYLISTKLGIKSNVEIENNKSRSPKRITIYKN